MAPKLFAKLIITRQSATVLPVSKEAHTFLASVLNVVLTETVPLMRNVILVHSLVLLCAEVTLVHPGLDVKHRITGRLAFATHLSKEMALLLAHNLSLRMNLSAGLTQIAGLNWPV